MEAVNQNKGGSIVQKTFISKPRYPGMTYMYQSWKVTRPIWNLTKYLMCLETLRQDLDNLGRELN